MDHFLPEEALDQIVSAIKTAEQNTTGEIRVHIDNNTLCRNAEKAFEVFTLLCKDQTAEKNAVLFHINFSQKYLTIIGDTGIHQKVCQHFWDRLHDETTEEFAKGNFGSALEKAILKTGNELKKHFPSNEKNPNELPDEITFS
ncbi:TPM domain-containing protein [Bergeyella sp. RCAD1439]|uniref:TPM domain-containing protein n=1 Tax=Bergeyella anatis TaxID=3113737 RepID=UPI002E16CC89|nr:TPM domain-containing protein [Bergeyella sp. RCAD1439]